jgi:hypothetical protein
MGKARPAVINWLMAGWSCASGVCWRLGGSRADAERQQGTEKTPIRRGCAASQASHHATLLPRARPRPQLLQRVPGPLANPVPERLLHSSAAVLLGLPYRVDCSSWHLALQIVAATSNVQALNTWLWRSVYLLYSLLDRPSLRLGPPSCDNRNCTKSRRALAASPLSFPSTPFCPNPSPGFHREH